MLRKLIKSTIMKRVIVLLSLPVLFSFIGESLSSPDKLGEDVFNLILEKKEADIYDYLIKKEEFGATIDSSDMDKTMAEEFKVQFYQKLSADSLKARGRIKRGYDFIQEVMKKKSCRKNIEIDTIITRINKMRNLPLELGDVQVVFHCDSDTQKVNMSVINTIYGWRLSDNLRLEYKASNYDK